MGIYIPTWIVWKHISRVWLVLFVSELLLDKTCVVCRGAPVSLIKLGHIWAVPFAISSQLQHLPSTSDHGGPWNHWFLENFEVGGKKIGKIWILLYFYHFLFYTIVSCSFFYIETYKRKLSGSSSHMWILSVNEYTSKGNEKASDWGMWRNRRGMWF